MSVSSLPTILDQTFRASADYELTQYDHLLPDEQEALAAMAEDPDFYGVLRARPNSGKTMKAVGPDAALLFMTLGRPGPIPRYVLLRLGEEANAFIARLLYDGILEMRADGDYVSGAAAYRLLSRGRTADEESGLISRLSREAVQYGERLRLDSAVELTGRLYLYNRRPLTPRWQALLRDGEAVAGFLGIDAGRPLHAQLDRHWSLLGAANVSEGWWAWRNRHVTAPADRTGILWKAYISPTPETLPEVLATTIPLFVESGVPLFKVGATAYGVLRPDKLIAYFYRQDDLHRVVAALERELHDVPAQGVPFTTQASTSGLISWGVDPPREKFELSWLERTSWRLWVCRELASALLLARQQQGHGLPPWQFAIDRLQLHGLDPQTWQPSESTWRAFLDRLDSE